MDIQFNCPACDKTLAIDEKYSGKQAICPKCRKELTIASRSAIEEIRCPSCNAIVEKGAVFCISCGTNLITGKKMQAPEETKQPRIYKIARDVLSSLMG